MNIFDKVAAQAITDNLRQYFSFGRPLNDEDHIKARNTAFASLRGGKGFRQEAKQQRKNAQGLTRGQRKKLAYAAMIAKIEAQRKEAQEMWNKIMRSGPCQFDTVISAFYESNNGRKVL